MNNFGAQAACAVAQRLETLGRDDRLIDAWNELVKLRPLVEQLQQALCEFVA